MERKIEACRELKIVYERAIFKSCNTHTQAHNRTLNGTIKFNSFVTFDANHDSSSDDGRKHLPNANVGLQSSNTMISIVAKRNVKQ
jgi:hypothetical protein